MGAMFSGGPGDTFHDVDVYVTRCQGPEVAETPRAKLQVIFVVECKYAPNPWVLLGARPQRDMNHVPQYFPRSANLPGKFRRLRKGPRTLAKEHVSTFTVSHGAKVCMLNARAKSERADPFFAIEKTVSIAWAAALEPQRQAGHNDTATHRVALPVIVLNGSLYRATFDESRRDMDVQPVSLGHVLYNKPPHPTLAAIVTLGALGAYLDALEPKLVAWARHAHNQGTSAPIHTPILGAGLANTLRRIKEGETAGAKGSG